jgi:alkylhydroperoxidase family enzyme
VLEDFETAPIAEGLRATLRMIRVLTLTPEAVTPEHMRAVLAQGVTREAVREALNVVFLFSIYDRLADALGWQIPPPEGFAVSAKRLVDRGYL